MKKRMMPVRISAKRGFRLNTLEISLARGSGPDKKAREDHHDGVELGHKSLEDMVIFFVRENNIIQIVCLKEIVKFVHADYCSFRNSHP